MLFITLIILSTLCFIFASIIESSQKVQDTPKVQPSKEFGQDTEEFKFDAKAFLAYERIRTAHLNEHNVD